MRGSHCNLRGLSLQHQNHTLVATGFFIKDTAIVTPLSSTHLVCSWVIYWQCQPPLKLPLPRHAHTDTHTQETLVHVCLLFTAAKIECTFNYLQLKAHVLVYYAHNFVAEKDSSGICGVWSMRGNLMDSMPMVRSKIQVKCMFFDLVPFIPSFPR